MNELISDPKFSLLVAGAFMGLLVWLGKRQIRRIDALEQTSVSKADIERMHGENTRKLEGIAVGVTATHRRIDEIYRDLLNRK